MFLGNLMKQEVDPLFWITEINKGNANMACDGSVKDSKGSYAAIFRSGDSTLEFQGLVFCAPTLLTSYQAELCGVLALHYLLSTMTNFSGIQLTQASTLHCDNEVAVATSTTAKTRPRTSPQLVLDIDIIPEIRQLKKSIPINPKWVKEHQDRIRKNSELSEEEKLNIVVDKAAGKYLTGHQTTPSNVPIQLPSQIVDLIISEVVVTSQICPTLHEHIPNVDIQHHITEKKLWTQQQFNMVRWPEIKILFSSFKLQKQVHIVNFSYNWLNIGT
eukprot:14216532-Ditylum_brightwellii.AAC.1